MNKKRESVLSESISHSKKEIILTPILMICEVILEILIPLLMAALVDKGIRNQDDYLLKWLLGGLNVTKLQFIGIVGIIMIIISVLSMIFGVLGAKTSSVGGSTFAFYLRAKVFKKIESLSHADIDKLTPGALINRVTTDVSSVQTAFQACIRSLVRSPMMLIFAVIMSFAINPKLSLMFCLAIPILFCSLTFVMITARRRYSKMMKSQDKLNGCVQENLTAIKTVKAYNKEDSEIEKFNNLSSEVKNLTVNAQKLYTFSFFCQLIVLYSLTIFILLVGGKDVLLRGASYGDLVAVLTYSSQIIGALAMLSTMITMVARSRASLDRIKQVLCVQNSIVDGSCEKPIQYGKIVFDNVSFCYDENLQIPVLHNISFAVNSGESVAIVGATGGGKSTVVKLIARLYDVSSGAILIDGIDVKNYKLKVLRDAIGFVPQVNTLFYGTVKENICFGNINASQSDVEIAGQLSCCDEFVDKMIDKYESLVMRSGDNFSGGQKQRICIARAIVGSPKILILDDSLSAVDTITEKKINDAIIQKLGNITKIIVAQRISTILNADKILVVDKGKVVDFGTHKQLIERCEVYKNIYNSQERL